MKINKIYYLSVALLLAGCSREAAISSDSLSGGSKTPLTIEASLSETPLTRAAGKTFAENDVLLAYIRHINNTNEAVASYASITADQAPRLVSFTKGSASMEDANANDGIKETSDLTASYTSTSSANVSALYWDDFSNSSSTTTDLRTENHGLQSYYGYCYNGGTPSTALVAETGVLGWTIGNQTTAEAVQHSDLLWSPAQEAVTYAHADARTGAHGTITIPYTHAMSEVTVTVQTVEGYTNITAPLASTALTLYGVNTVTTFTAPTGTYSSGTSANISMYGDTYTSGQSRNYTAIVAPGTKIKEGTKLLDIKGVDDNDYTLTVTSNMLTAVTWAKDHTVGTDDGNYILTKPGYNYHLTVTVNKTSIQTKATLADWTTVNATGTGDIVFPDDDTNLIMDDTETPGQTGVQVVAVDKNKFVADATFSLFTLKSESTNAEATARTNDSYEYATIPKFKDNEGDVNDEWVNNPAIYWPNKTDNYYFRALAKFNSCTNGVNSISSVGAHNTDKGVAVSQGTIADGHDILWGTTAAHKGSTNNKTYQRGQAIPPRTGDVPIAFDHAMSKITINLETTSDESVTMYNAKVDLTNATIAISNLYTSGTITIENGTITYTDANKVENAITATAAPLSNFCVIPQTISNDAKVTITLNDGTTYKLQLNQCLDSQTTPAAIGTWERGKFYIYTIHLEKEQITFRALIKDWEEKTGSGNANLEWD